MKDFLVGLAVMIFIAVFGTWLYAPHILEAWIDRLCFSY